MAATAPTPAAIAVVGAAVAERQQQDDDDDNVIVIVDHIICDLGWGAWFGVGCPFAACTAERRQQCRRAASTSEGKREGQGKGTGMNESGHSQASTSEGKTSRL